MDEGQKMLGLFKDETERFHFSPDLLLQVLEPIRGPSTTKSRNYGA